MSDTVTISDQRSYIKIETLHGKNPTEIHGALSEVCGEFTVEHSMVSHEYKFVTRAISKVMNMLAVP